ncbi:YolD-like family protein [Mesobacillus maritimus]|uniref:YolD-like family protein n=1 Tax=Mesobacillus maritimus TaxID=1643336 RepID=UPI00384C0D9C
MFLKKLAKEAPLTISYIQNGFMQTCTGRLLSLDLKMQTLSLKDENQQVYSIHLSGIKTID